MLQINDNSSSIYDDFIKDVDVRPTKRQEDFLSLPDEIFEALYGGAAYGGKSWILTMLPLFRGFYKYRGFKGIILRRSFPDLEREIIRLSQEWYPKTGGIYNEQKHTWSWKDYGSYMDFGHVKQSSSIKMYDSAQYNYCSFDEVTHFEEYPYVYMVDSRVRPGSADLKIAIARAGTNPGGIGQTWCYNRFVRPCESGYKVIKDAKTGLYRIFIPAFIQDNPHGLEYDPLYANKLEGLPEAEKKAKKYGDWHAFKGSVFTTFRPIPFKGEPENALHVIKPFLIPDWWPRILSIDWGKKAMCYAMWGAISPDKRVYIYREKHWYGKDIAYWASDIKETNDNFNERITYTVLCGSAWQDKGDDTIANQFREHSGLAADSSSNTPGSRIIGLQLIHEFLRWEPRKTLKAKGEVFDLEFAQRLYRIHGEAAYEAYKREFTDEPIELNLPILQIFDCCKILIETIPVCIHDEKKVEDIAEFEGDDPIDDLRYFCRAVKRFLNGEIGDLERSAKISAITKELEVSNDMTKYYRQLENLEKGNNLVGIKTIRPVGIVARRARRRSSYV